MKRKVKMKLFIKEYCLVANLWIFPISVNWLEIKWYFWIKFQHFHGSYVSILDRKKFSSNFQFKESHQTNTCDILGLLVQPRLPFIEKETVQKVLVSRLRVLPRNHLQAKQKAVSSHKPLAVSFGICRNSNTSAEGGERGYLSPSGAWKLFSALKFICVLVVVLVMVLFDFKFPSTTCHANLRTTKVFSYYQWKMKNKIWAPDKGRHHCTFWRAGPNISGRCPTLERPGTLGQMEPETLGTSLNLWWAQFLHL